LTVSDEYLEKVRSVLTTEWQSTIDIAHWAEVSSRHTLYALKELQQRGDMELKEAVKEGAAKGEAWFT